MAKLLSVKPKKMSHYTGKKLLYGEIPRRIKVGGKVWTWKNQIWGMTLNETADEYRKKNYLIKMVTVKGRKQLYIRSGR